MNDRYWRKRAALTDLALAKFMKVMATAFINDLSVLHAMNSLAEEWARDMEELDKKHGGDNSLLQWVDLEDYEPATTQKEIEHLKREACIVEEDHE